MSDNMFAVPICNIMDQKQARYQTQVVSPVDASGRRVHARGNDLISRPSLATKPIGAMSRVKND
jgi:hypothetical protein